MLMEKGSKINPLLTMEYMLAEPENKYFDRKSAHIKTSDLAPWVAGFANAEGGTIVIGISDKTQKLEGINSVGADKINDFLNMAKDYCKPMPQMQEEFLPVVNEHGAPDKILLLKLPTSPTLFI